MTALSRAVTGAESLSSTRMNISHFEETKVCQAASPAEEESHGEPAQDGAEPAVDALRAQQRSFGDLARYIIMDGKNRHGSGHVLNCVTSTTGRIHHVLNCGNEA